MKELHGQVPKTIMNIWSLRTIIQASTTIVSMVLGTQFANNEVSGPSWEFLACCSHCQLMGKVCLQIRLELKALT